MCFTGGLLTISSGRPWIRWAARVAAVAFGVLTAGLAIRMLWYLFHSWSNVPWRDQWPLLEEIRAFEEGRYGWSYLWAPYWGVRIVIPRLLFLFTAKFFSFSNGPLVLTNVSAQFSAAAMLGFTAWRVLRKHSPDLRWFAIIVTVNLLLCPLQLENIIWGMGVEFTAGYVAGLAAIVLLGRFSSRFSSMIGAVFFALVSTLSAGAGLILWPILCLESWIMGCAKKCAPVFGIIGLVAAGVYMIGYQRPDMGMGFGGMLRRPVAAVRIAGLILGGPISVRSRSWSTAAGCVGLIAAAYLFYYVIRRWRTAGVGLIIEAALVLFFLGIVLSIVAGRISPEWLLGRQGAPVPSRYFTPAFVFWASLFPAMLSLAFESDVLGRVLASGTGAIVIALTLGTVTWQIEAPASWAFLFRSMDAAASAFFTGASDEEYQSEMYPEKPVRDRGVDYLRQKRWSVFAEDRATWIGKPLHDRFSLAATGLCRGTVELMKPVFPDRALRITGRVIEDKTCSADPVEILITGSDDAVIGQGRALLPTFTPFGSREVSYLAYARIPPGQNSVRIYASLPGNRVTLLAQLQYDVARMNRGTP